MATRRSNSNYNQEERQSVVASIENAFDTAPGSAQNSPAFELPSQHSGFRSVANTAEGSEVESDGPWSPPAWRRPGSGWFQHERLQAALSPSPQRSREGSPSKEEDITIAANVPLPRSPRKGSPSPAPEVKAEEDDEKQSGQRSMSPEQSPDRSENYIRFGANLQVQHRTDSIEMLIHLVRRQYARITSSKANFIAFMSSIVLIVSVFRALFSPLDTGPGPDLVKVAGLARSFEPLIHFSENGVQQIGDLQETGVAVWDLSESVRQSNMTSAPVIVRELDDLSESLKSLALELTKFFANVDGDIDSILIVMEWAQRELARVAAPPAPHTLSGAYSNLNTYLARVPGGEALTSVTTSLFGTTHSSIQRRALQRAFDEFLNVLEESINTELTHSLALFSLFTTIDRQFLNLQRTVIRETDSQEEQKDELLADLWRRLLGGNQARLNKYARNKKLLESIKQRTVHNKRVLVEHNGKLLTLKSNLEILRKRLVSPLVRSNESSTLSVAEQIDGMGDTYEMLRKARERQKSRVMEGMFGSNRHAGTAAWPTIGDEGVGALR